MEKLRKISELKKKSIPIEVASDNIAIALPPSIFIKQALDEREWTQTSFAEVIGKSEAYVHKLLTNKTRISLRLAEILGTALGPDANFWMGLEMAYQKDLDAEKPHLMEIEIRSILYNLLPIDQMLDREMVKAGKSAYDLMISVLKLLQLESLDESCIQLKLKGALRTAKRDQNLLAILAWLNSARREVDKYQLLNRYDTKQIKTIVNNFRELTRKDNGPLEVTKMLWDNGIQVIHYSHLKKTSIDGAAFWIDRDNPVIVLTLRRKRLDNFWFTLFHELGHIINDGYFTYYDYSEFKSTDASDSREKCPNKFAADILIPPDLWTHLKHRCASSKYISGSMLRSFACVANVHPAIVAGRLRKERVVPWSHFNKGDFGATINIDDIISVINKYLSRQVSSKT